MKQILKKTVRVGLGTGAIVKEKAESLISKNRKELSKETQEGKKMVNDFLKKNKVDVKKTIRKNMKVVLDTVGVATKEDIESLKRKK